MAYFGDPRREFFASDPAAELGSFAWNVFDDVGALVDMREDLFPRYTEEPDVAIEGFDEFRELVGQAFGVVLTTRDGFVQEILALDPEQLERIGLVGPELALKMAAWQASRDLLTALLRRSGGEEEQQEFVVPPSARVRPAEKIPLVRRIARRVPILRPLLITGKAALERADIALGSLVKLAPLGERLIELKEMVESGMGELADRMD